MILYRDIFHLMKSLRNKKNIHFTTPRVRDVHTKILSRARIIVHFVYNYTKCISAYKIAIIIVDYVAFLFFISLRIV